jgi:hypothetical protein
MIVGFMLMLMLVFPVVVVFMVMAIIANRYQVHVTNRAIAGLIIYLVALAFHRAIIFTMCCIFHI